MSISALGCAASFVAQRPFVHLAPQDLHALPSIRVVSLFFCHQILTFNENAIT